MAPFLQTKARDDRKLYRHTLAFGRHCMKARVGHKIHHRMENDRTRIPVVKACCYLPRHAHMHHSAPRTANRNLTEAGGHYFAMTAAGLDLAVTSAALAN
jgi:hypothetical protein